MDKQKRITVVYLPALGIETDIYETTGKAGYHIHADEATGAVIGYRIYVDQTTILIPRENVQKIETIL